MPIKQEIKILNMSDQVVTVLSNDAMPGTCPFWGDRVKEVLNDPYQSLEFTIPGLHEKAVYVQNEYKAAVSNGQGDFFLFRIKRVEDVTEGGQAVKTVFAEAEALELLYTIIPPKSYAALNAQQILDDILMGTEWKRGIVEWSGSRTIKIEKYQTALETIQTLRASFSSDLRFRVTIDDYKITGKYVDFLPRLGEDTGKRFEYDKDLDGLTKTESSEELFTAMYGVGQSLENGGYTTFKNIVWDKSNGDPADKPSGQEWIGDEDALDRWGKDGRHLFGIYENSEQKDPATLLTQTWAELQKKKNPAPSYTAQVKLLGKVLGLEHEEISIGDTVEIKDNSYPEPLLLSARIVEYEWSLTDPDADEVVIGEYVRRYTRTFDLIEDLRNLLTPYIGTWNAALRLLQADEPPENPEVGTYWQDMDGQPKIIYRWSGTEWEATSATTAAELGAITAGEAEEIVRENAELPVFKQASQPTEASIGQLWIDTSQTPNILKRWDGVTWTKATPTAAGEVGAENQIYQGTTAPANTAAKWLDTTKAPYVLKVYNPTAAAWVPASPTTPGDVGAQANITQSATAPTNPAAGALWVDISVTPNILKRWSGTEWQKATPTTAGEVGADQAGAAAAAQAAAQKYAEQQAAAAQAAAEEVARTEAAQAQAQAEAYADGVLTEEERQNLANYDTDLAAARTYAEEQAAAAEQAAKDASEPNIYEGTTAPTDTSKKWLDTTKSPYVMKSWNATAAAWVPASPQTAADIGAQANIYQGNSAPTGPTLGALWLNTSITPNILNRWNGTAWVKAAPTTAAEIGAQSNIYQGTAAPTGAAAGAIWLNTGVTPNIFMRYNGTAWVKATPSAPGEVGADPAGSAATAEQNAKNYAEPEIYEGTTAPTDLTKKWLDTTKAPYVLKTWNATAQAWVSASPQTAADVGAQMAIAQQTTAPASPAAGALWLDTSKTPNILKRWTGTAWANATPTTPGEVGAQATITQAAAAPASPTAGAIWLDTSVTPNILKRYSGTAWVNATPTKPGEVGAEPGIVQSTTAPTDKTVKWLDTTKSPYVLKVWNATAGAWVPTAPQTPADIGAQPIITQGDTAPASPAAGTLWLDTRSTPSILYRWNGTTWAATTPLTFAELQGQLDAGLLKPGTVIGSDILFSGELRGAKGTFTGALTQDGTYGDVTIQNGLVEVKNNAADKVIQIQEGEFEVYQYKGTSTQILPMKIFSADVNNVMVTAPALGAGTAAQLAGIIFVDDTDINPAGGYFASSRMRYLVKASTAIPGSGFHSFEGGPVNVLSGLDVKGGAAISGNLNMQNSNIDNVNLLTFNDPGSGEGISWLGGSLWKIYESPDDLSNGTGNLQIVQGSTRRGTFKTNGDFWVSGNVTSDGGLSLSAPGNIVMNCTDPSGAMLVVGQDGIGRVYSLDIYNRTYSSGATMTVTNQGTLGRISSSKKYKLVIDDLEVDPRKIYKLSPRTWYDRNSVERLADLMTRQYNGEDVNPDEMDLSYLERIPGLVSEEVIEAGLEEFIIWGDQDGDGKREPEGLMYERLWIILLPLIKEIDERTDKLEKIIKEKDQKIESQDKKIEDLETRLAKLEKLFAQQGK